MAIKSKMADRRIEIDLTGPQGNAYGLMAAASKLSKQLGIDQGPILADMKSGNYEHLLDVFEKHFGDYVDLYR